MNATYPAVYRDKQGEESITIHNDGKLLRMVIRGIPFVGEDFDFMEAAVPADPHQLASFILAAGYLCDCELEWDIPIEVVSDNQIVPGMIHAHLKLGPPRPSGTASSETLQLRLSFDEKDYTSCGHHGAFEDELVEIQRTLPDGMYLKCCFSCAFSDYHPAGNGLFGDMLCFRDNKQAYLQISGKMDLLRILHTMTEKVQETYLCPEFEKRIPGAGYRG